MADYLVQGNKTVYCKCGYANVVPFQQTSCTCSSCGHKFVVAFHGVLVDKHGHYN